MIVKIYSVYDSKLEAFMQPFFMQSKGLALRAFSDTALDSNTVIGKHPSDYTLFELGEFDDASAKFVMHSTPISLGVAIEFIKSNDCSALAEG